MIDVPDQAFQRLLGHSLPQSMTYRTKHGVDYDGLLRTDFRKAGSPSRGGRHDSEALPRPIEELKWSGKFGQRAKMYPTRMNGYENDEATEFFR